MEVVRTLLRCTLSGCRTLHVSDSPSAQVGANVRAEMARRRIPQRQLAEALGLSQAGVSKRLNGLTPWDVNEITVVAESLGVPVSALIGDTQAVA